LNFTVYKSSAGSGKTFTLVKEYLRIALDDTADPPQRYRQILAITFTNKAASEMKERIISALKELSSPLSGQLSPLSEILVDELKLDAFTIASRARDVLRAILHNYSDFAIGTIDSFTHRIVRAFAHDLHLPVNFEVETDGQKIIREAVDVLVSRIGEDEKLTEVLIRFSEHRADDQKSWQIEQELRQIAKHLLEEDGARKAELLRKLSIDDFLLIRDKLFVTTAAFEKKIQSLAAAVWEKITAAGLLIEDFAYGKTGIAPRLKAYASGDIEKFNDENSNIRKTIESGKWFGGKTTASAKLAIESLQGEIETVWNELETIREKESGRYILRSLLLRNIYALAVLNEIEKIIFGFRTDDNIIHISEFNRIISKVVFEEPVPFIYERLGEKYNNYLIDEFQDTSVSQWQNLLPLVDNALAGNHFTMLVGDGKQAIYRWRGGEVEQFARLPQITLFSDNPLVKDREQSLKRNYSAKHLGKNYRSLSGIIQFNNSFFRQLSSLLSPTHEKIYDKQEQAWDEQKPGGYIQIEALEPDEELDSNFVSKTVQQVRSLYEEGVRLNDIAVLTRTNREGSIIASALLGAGFPVLSSESLLLKQSPAVNFLVSLLRCIDQPGDELASARALEFLVSIRKLPAPLHNQLLEFQENGKRIDVLVRKNGFAFDTAKLARLPLYQRCEEIIAAFGLAEKMDSYLLFFLDEILSYSHARNSEKTNFDEWWDERSMKASVVVPEGMNAVQVMTVHKSKGLEFPVVILPFANWKFKKQKDDLWVDLNDSLFPELPAALIPASEKLRKTPLSDLYEDEISKSRLDILNVLYVAMTRPRNRLYVLTSKAKTSKEEPKNLDELFAFALAKMEIVSENGVFSIGTPAPIQARKQLKENHIRPTAIHSVNWQDRISIRAQAPENWDLQKPGSKREESILIQILLSKIQTKADLAKAIKELQADGRLGAIPPDWLNQRAQAIISNPELEICFSANALHRIEPELILQNGKTVRPHRISEINGKVILLNFRTEEAEDKHRQQLDHAAAVLKSMGYSKIECRILYSESMKIVSWQSE
jgi:ATP-dependent exoDNAse (exonuclease V) beta subunit